MGAKLTAIDYHFPQKQLSNYDLSLEFPNYDFSNFESKVGIENRYIVTENETALDLAIKACEKLFKRFDKSRIDFILYCSQSPEYLLPTTACILQDKLMLRTNVGALDFNLGCSGYTYGLSLSKSLIESKQAKNVLLVTAETYSKHLHPQDRSNRAIFGDAATASIISFSDDDEIGDFLFGTDGAGYNKLIIKNGGSRYNYEPEAKEISYGTENVYTDNNLYMDGPAIFNFTSEKIPAFTNEVLEKNNISIDQISQFVFHQANAFMLNLLRKKLKVATEHFYIDLKDGGNTVSCTIPIALKRYSDNHTFLTTEKLVVMGFGVGLSWCGGVIKLNSKL